MDPDNERCPRHPRRARQVSRAAVELASDVKGPELVLGTTLGDRYRVRDTDDGGVVGLSRSESGGEGGIRTHEELAPLTVLQCVLAGDR